MKGIITQLGKRSGKLLAVFALLAVLLLTGGSWNASAQGSSNGNQPNLVQDFQDVATNNLFYGFIHNLYSDGIVAGTPCTVAAGPYQCVAPANLPYFRPGDPVKRNELSKFVDNGRRNIADAIGNSLTISSTVDNPILARTTSNGEGLRGECLNPSSACYGVYGLTYGTAFGVYGACKTANNGCDAIHGTALAGEYAGYFTGGKGVYASSADTNTYGLQGNASGSGSYGVYGLSTSNRGVNAKTGNVGSWSLYSEAAGGNHTTTSAHIEGGAFIEGDLSVGGSKGGYVIDMMQNADDQPLAVGDVVVIADAGSSEAIYGQIPVITVKKATTAYDTGVVGVVDKVMNVPSKAVRAQYAKEKAAREAAISQRDSLMMQVSTDGKNKSNAASAIVIPSFSMNEKDAFPEANTNATSVQPGGYINVVTLGSYKAVKVDASFGPIKSGDLLVASSNPGYAMKASDKSQTSGAVIGKALGNLASGTGTLPVMVTLK